MFTKNKKVILRLPKKKEKKVILINENLSGIEIRERERTNAPYKTTFSSTIL